MLGISGFVSGNSDNAFTFRLNTYLSGIDVVDDDWLVSVSSLSRFVVPVQLLLFVVGVALSKCFIHRLHLLLYFVLLVPVLLLLLRKLQLLTVNIHWRLLRTKETVDLVYSLVLFLRLSPAVTWKLEVRSWNPEYRFLLRQRFQGSS